MKNMLLADKLDSDTENIYKRIHKNMQLSKKHIYFNSGVMVINCKKWPFRKQNHVIKKYIDKTIAVDQDILNKMFECNYKILETKYNCGYSARDKFRPKSDFNHEAKKAIIYHTKFWKNLRLKGHNYNYVKEWWGLLRKTPFFWKIFFKSCIDNEERILISYYLKKLLRKPPNYKFNFFKR
jgi:lipopolysaccharide biosynthesis glycosyltransferase